MGNQAIQSLHEQGKVQPKLAVSRPKDDSERQADRLANVILTKDESQQLADTEFAWSRSTVNEGPAIKQGTEHQIRNLTRGGKPMSKATRSFFEQRFNQDFSDVRVHTGREADKAARSIRAEAFTFGTDIVFSEGSYRPNTPSGKRLLAHELAHVVQQTRGITGSGRTVQRQQSESKSESASESTLNISPETMKNLEAAAQEIATELAKKAAAGAGVSWLIIASELGGAAAEGVGAGIELARAEMQREESRYEMDLERIEGTKHLQEGVEKLEISASERYERFLEKPIQVDRKYMKRAAEKLHIVAEEMFIKVVKKGAGMISSEIIGSIMGKVEKLGEAVQSIVSDLGTSWFSWLFGYSWSELIEDPVEGKLKEIKKAVKELVEETLREKFDQHRKPWYEQ